MSKLRFALLASLTLAACTQSRVPLGTHDAGAEDGAVRCGPATCAAGEVCCNASCGICAPFGEGCIAIACPFTCGAEVCEPGVSACCPGCAPGQSMCAGPGGECPPVACPPPTSCADGSECFDGQECCTSCDGTSFCAEPGTSCPDLLCPPRECESDVDCGMGAACCSDCGGGSFCSEGPCPLCPDPDVCRPMDAVGEGFCDLALGVVWDGASCVSISGCSCSGADCGRLHSSLEACEAVTAMCTSMGGCTTDLECGNASWCDPCAHGSCPACADCVQDCAPSPCATGEAPTCRLRRPECGDGVAIVRDGCWVCVDAHSCEPFAPGDCRETGCPAGSTCTACFAGHACLAEGMACAF